MSFLKLSSMQVSIAPAVVAHLCYLTLGGVFILPPSGIK